MFVLELSVIAFGLFSGHLLESRSSVRRILRASVGVAILFVVTMACVEFLASRSVCSSDPFCHLEKHKTSNIERHLFGHGGVGFWMIISGCLAFIYALALAIPVLPCKRWLTIPNKKSVYHYMFFLLLLNIVQAVGCAMISSHSMPGQSTGMCFVNLTNYLHLVAFTPIVYFTFLSQFLGSKSVQPTLLFSYNAQVNDMDCDEYGYQKSLAVLSAASEDDRHQTIESSLSLEHSNGPIIIGGGNQ